MHYYSGDHQVILFLFSSNWCSVLSVSSVSGRGREMRPTVSGLSSPGRVSLPVPGLAALGRGQHWQLFLL